MPSDVNLFANYFLGAGVLILSTLKRHECMLEWTAQCLKGQSHGRLWAIVVVAWVSMFVLLAKLQGDILVRTRQARRHDVFVALALLAIIWWHMGGPLNDLIANPKSSGHSMAPLLDIRKPT